MHRTKGKYKAVIIVRVVVLVFVVLLTGVWQEPRQMVNVEKESIVSELERSPLTFKAGNSYYRLLPEDIKYLFDIDLLKNSRQEGGVAQALASYASIIAMGFHDVAGIIGEKLSKEPLPERYSFSQQELVILPAEKGQLVTVNDVIYALKHYRGGTTVEIGFQEIGTLDGTKLEPLSLVGSYETRYDLEEDDRNINMAKAANAIHGKILLPGEVFSFNQVVGKRTISRGFRYADVIVENRHVPGLGGGICQVATTLFNASVRSGLDFLEVHAHSIPTDYIDPGRDATVSWGYLDLKIKNNFSTPVLFGAWVKDGLVTVRVFGKPNGNEYELEPIILEEYPVEGMIPGLLVETYRVVKREGKVTHRHLLHKSRYNASYPEG